MNIQKINQANRGTIVDVRTSAEFNEGHAVSSINIPLHQIIQRMEEIKKLALPLTLCCASGSRSGQAQEFISGSGMDFINGGSWMDVEKFQIQTA